MYELVASTPECVNHILNLVNYYVCGFVCIKALNVTDPVLHS